MQTINLTPAMVIFKSRPMLLSICLLLIKVSGTFAQSYQAPVFTDRDRLNKIASTYAVIDQLYKDWAEKNHIPGLAYGIVLDGRLVHSGGVGYTDIEHKVPATSKSDFRIASMTKSFTAMAILKLRDEGKLKLDDPIALYIPEAKNLKYLTKDATPVTIRNILMHAAGFPEDNPWGDRQLAATDVDLLMLYKKGISFSNDPGLGYEYSNLGFATLGYIIKKVTGKPYDEYITQYLLKPLGMTHTYWQYTDVPAQQLAHGYRWLDNKWVEQPLLHDGVYGAMGGLITTIEDFSKYMALHQAAWPPRDDVDAGPIKRSSIREMQYPWDIASLNANAKTPAGKPCPTVSAYGYGLRWSKDCNDRVTVGHTGGLPGFGSQWLIMPEYGIGIMVFANRTYASAGSINTRVLDTLLTLTQLGPRSLPPSAILNRRKTELIKLLPDFTDARVSGIFAQNFFMDYLSDKIKAEAVAAFAKAGKINRIDELVPENNLRGYFIMEGENANIKISFSLTPQNPALIQSYQLDIITR